MKLSKFVVLLTALMLVTGCSETKKETTKEPEQKEEINNYEAGHSNGQGMAIGNQNQKPMTFDEATKLLSKMNDTEEVFGTIENSADYWDVVSKEERIAITEDLVKQFEAGTYLEDNVVLKNLYNSALAAESYSREYKMQTPSDPIEAAYNDICFNLYRNLKFYYRGVEPKDSKVILDNENATIDAVLFIRTNVN